MFGLRGLKRLGGVHTESSLPAPRQGMILVCKEDIYRERRGTEPVLLLKKGAEVSATELPRFIRNGASPHQFHIRFVTEHTDSPTSQLTDERQTPAFERNTDERNIERITESTLEESARGISNPIINPPESSLSARAVRSRKRVLILEPEQKSLKRLIDCLFVCGFHLDRIHPVRMPAHLSWSLEKYRPDILIVDYRLDGNGSVNQNGLSMLEALPLSELSSIQILLTVPPEQKLNLIEMKVIRKLCLAKNIGILHKPVSRFSLNSLLDEIAAHPA